jgi:hypothetical protein
MTEQGMEITLSEQPKKQVSAIAVNMEFISIVNMSSLA